jgi:hypothetical protein
VCAKTAIGQTDQAALEGKLLEWVLGGITVQCLRRTLARDTSREVVAKQTVPVLLLMRRVMVYMSNRFQFLNEEGKEYAAGRSPRNVISEVFGTWQSFHAVYPKGAPATAGLPKASSQDKEGGQEESVSCNPASTFAACLPAPQRKIIEFLRVLMDFRVDIKAVVCNSIQKDINITAEVFMGQQEFKGDGLFNFEGLLQDGKRLNWF